MVLTIYFFLYMSWQIHCFYLLNHVISVHIGSNGVCKIIRLGITFIMILEGAFETLVGWDMPQIWEWILYLRVLQVMWGTNFWGCKKFLWLVEIFGCHEGQESHMIICGGRAQTIAVKRHDVPFKATMLFKSRPFRCEWWELCCLPSK